MVLLWLEYWVGSIYVDVEAIIMWIYDECCCQCEIMWVGLQVEIATRRRRSTAIHDTLTHLCETLKQQNNHRKVIAEQQLAETHTHLKAYAANYLCVM